MGEMPVLLLIVVVEGGVSILVVYVIPVCSKIGRRYSKIGNLCSKTEMTCYAGLIFAGQAADPPLELPIKSGWAIKPATTIGFGECVVSFAEQLKTFLYSIARKEIVKSYVGEATEEDV